jgi:hypothetical protein
MAEKTKATKVENEESREDIFIPKGSSREDANLFVSVNGRNFLLPKGKTSNVPSYVAAEIRRAWGAAEQGDAKNDELLDMGKEPVYRI